MLRGLYKHGNKAVLDFPPLEVARCIRSLQDKGLARGAFVEGGTLEAATITGAGESYIRQNPKLRNPIDWKWTLPISMIAIAATCLILAITKG